jgi:hypothetical protein
MEHATLLGQGQRFTRKAVSKGFLGEASGVSRIAVDGLSCACQPNAVGRTAALAKTLLLRLRRGIRRIHVHEDVRAGAAPESELGVFMSQAG